MNILDYLFKGYRKATEEIEEKAPETLNKYAQGAKSRLLHDKLKCNPISNSIGLL